LTTTQGVGYRLTSQSSADAGIDLSLVAGATPITVDAQATGMVSGNAVVTLTGGASAIASLNLQGTSSQAALVDVSSAATVTSWKATVGQSKVDVKCSALVITNLQVDGSDVSFFQSCDTSAAASVTIANLNWTSAGHILVSGGSATIGMNGAAEATQTGSGEIQASGSVSLDGVLAAGVTLTVAGSGKSAPLAVIDTGKKLDFRGTTVSGTAGTIAVNGQFWVGAMTNAVQPKVIVNSGAQFVVASSNALTAEAINVEASGKFVLAASANRAAVHVKKIARWLGTVEIKLNVTASAFIASGGKGIGFTYDAAGVVLADLAKSTVVVTDSLGASTMLTTTASASASAGRRLLSGNNANYGSDSMTFSMTQNGASSMFGASIFATIIVLLVL